MTRHFRAFSLPLSLLLLLAFLLPSKLAVAQGVMPEGWRTGTGAVTDSFSRDEGNWTLDTGRVSLRTLARGRLTVRVPEPEVFRWATLAKRENFKDFYVEVDARQEAGAPDAMAGIIFRYEDVDNFYAFLVSADGWYALLKFVEGIASRPIDWSESEALGAGPRAENHLAVLANGREIAVFANGAELDRIQDRSFAEGQIALVAGTNLDGNLEVTFDNFGLWVKPIGAKDETTIGRQSINRSTSAVAQRPAGEVEALVSTESLNVRTGPGTNYAVVAVLRKGNGVQVIGRSADSKWAKLAYLDALEAWASAQYLTFSTDFAQVTVAKAPPAPAAPAKAPTQPARNDVAWLVIDNHIGRYITLQVNDQNYRVEGKAGETPGRFQFELHGVGRYRVAAQLPNGGSHNWDLYVELTADKCANRQGCVALGQTFLQTYY